MVEIYNKLPFELQEHIDVFIYASNKQDHKEKTKEALSELKKSAFRWTDDEIDFPRLRDPVLFFSFEKQVRYHEKKTIENAFKSLTYRQLQHYSDHGFYLAEEIRNRMRVKAWKIALNI